MLDFIVNLKSLYEKYERFNPFVFFVSGFTWDSLTLKRNDQLFDNLILLTYLLLLGTLILLLELINQSKVENRFLLKYRRWYPAAVQFLVGGLFSAYIIFYFQSASLTKTSIFLLVLILFFIANEFIHDRVQHLYLFVAFYFFASFSFFIFFIPVLFKFFNLFTFVFGGLVSTALVLGLVELLRRAGVFQRKIDFVRMVGFVLTLYAVVNLFYWQNWIPPVPLALKDGGIYHHASKGADGETFVLKYEKPPWYQFLRRSESTYRYASGDTVSCFTAVFAPTQLREEIVHHWQKFDPRREKWLTTDRLGFEILGYRDGGYRGITRKRHVSSGNWRVDIETDEQVLLGRIPFEVIPRSGDIQLKTIFR